MFNIKEVAAYLHLTPADISLLIKREEIPHVKQGERVVFRRSEIDEWASQRILQWPAQALADYHTRSSARMQEISVRRALMPDLITPERVDVALPSRTRASVIRDMVRLADTTGLVSDADDLRTMIEEREQLCSTALPGGLALLHPRHHAPYMFSESFMVLGRTVQAIHFGCQGGIPSDLFFLVCCQDDRSHLHTLARLCSMCMQTRMLEGLRTAETAAEMRTAICLAEEEVLRHL
jgi:PTS system nitrogen regulatory IIA component